MVSWNSASSIGGGELNEIDRDIRANVQQHLGAFASNFRVNELQSLARVLCIEVAGIGNAVVIS